jgi:CubicO group peptidase (beta-lactamase class C family)
MQKTIIIIWLCLFSFYSCSQNIKETHLGNYVGQLPDKNAFNFKINLDILDNEEYALVISNSKEIFNKTLAISENGKFEYNADGFGFSFELDQANEFLRGYIHSGTFYYYLTLQKSEGYSYTGQWNAFMVNNGLYSTEIFLNVDFYNNQIEAYPFLADQRFRGFYTKDFKLDGNLLKFRDSNVGLNMTAIFKEKSVVLRMYMFENLIAETTLDYYDEYWEPEVPETRNLQSTDTPKKLNDGWKIGSLEDVQINPEPISKMIDSIKKKSLVNIHSVLISKDNKLVFETYFDGFNANIPHDLRSASKSISSAIIGIAVDDGVIGNVDENLYDFVPSEYQYTKDSLKSKIKLKHLLTMSSGLAVNEEASEDNYQSNSNAWLKTVLEASMVNEPGTYADYGSANPFLLGVYLNERLNIPLQTYMDDNLFTPLGITNYINFTDDSDDLAYFGGGMLLTPRDMLKFGQLYLNKGRWNGKQIISENWVKESFGKYVRLQDYPDKNQYGYLWWHDTYEVNGKKIESIEARGAGGQFIFIVPELESVVVITAGNYRNRKGNQSREIFRDYVLPALKN